MSDKPLHVQVAEALGWLWKVSPSGGCRFLCPPTGDNPFGIEPDDYQNASDLDRACSDGLRYVTRYDTDWSATGPLIERYGIALVRTANGWLATVPDHVSYGDMWCDISMTTDGEGPAPLVAVCNLILALKAAGKLPMSEDKP